MPAPLFLALAFLAASPAAQKDASPSWATEMDTLLRERMKRFKGEFAVHVVDVERGEAYGYRDDVPMYLASGIKLAFMLTVYRAIESGELALTTELTYGEDDLRDGAPELNHQPLNQTYTVEQLLTWMMRASDNAASDLFVDRLGLKAVDQALVDEGIVGFGPLVRLIDVRRGIYRILDARADDLHPREIRKIRWTPIWRPQLRRLEKALGRSPRSFDEKAIHAAYMKFYATGVNRASMKAVAILFRRMLEGTLVSKEASRAMLELLAGARTSEKRLLGRLPRNSDVAHKTGSQYLRFCDLGIVFLPIPRKAPDQKGPPLIVTMCSKDAELTSAERLMAAVARRAYDMALAERKP